MSVFLCNWKICAVLFCFRFWDILFDIDVREIVFEKIGIHWVEARLEFVIWIFVELFFGVILSYIYKKLDVDYMILREE